MEKIKLGERLKGLRSQRNLSLRGLSALSGVQLATLSKIENNLTAGSIESHMKIAQAFGLELSEFYQGIRNRPKKEKIDIFNTPEDVILTNDKSSRQLLTHNISSKKLLPVLITIQPNGQTTPAPLSSKMEHFVYVLKGEVEIIIGESIYKASENNSISFVSTVSHYFKNTSRSVAKLIDVETKWKS